jgi:hypothetical protein
MTFDKWFNKQSRLIQLILLLIPGVSWITELLVRWSVALRKSDLFHILIAVLFTVCGLFLGLLDFVWVLLFKHLLFAK